MGAAEIAGIEAQAVVSLTNLPQTLITLSAEYARAIWS